MSMNILTYFVKVNAVFKMFYNYSMKQLIEPDMGCPTIWNVRLAQAQTSLCIRAV